jgi:ABC-type amino acid transport substrate-binding protein
MAEEVPTIRCGVLSMLNVTEAEMVNYKKARNLVGRQLEKEGLVTHRVRQILDFDNWKDAPFEIVYFDTLDAALMALNAGDIDEISIYQAVAQYLTYTDPNLVQIVTFKEGVEENTFARLAYTGFLSNDFAFMFMEDNEALRDEFDAALASITDAEIEKLVQDNITAAINGDEISPIRMPVIEGAQTIKVAVTGALPPMDYVAADGSPAGFNTALLAEISNRIGKNIELVVVDSVGRAAALASGTVDAVFWVRTNAESNRIAACSEEERARKREEDSKNLSADEIETMKTVEALVDLIDYGRADMPEGTVITAPYFSDIIVPVTTQARLDEGAARANQ